MDSYSRKETSRFSRSTLDTIQHTQKVPECDMRVLFQNDNISTLDSDSEFRLAVMAGAAQDEVRKLSGRLKFSFRQAIKKRPTCWAMTNCRAAAKAASLPSARRKPRWYNVSSTSMPISRRPSGAFWNAQNAEAHTVPIEAHLGVYSPYGVVLTGKFLLPLPPSKSGYSGRKDSPLRQQTSPSAEIRDPMRCRGELCRRRGG